MILKRNIRAFKPIFLHVIFPIFIGGAIYVIYRHNSITMFKWLEFLFLTDTVTLIREYLSPTREFIPDWVVFSMPDGLWVYSFSSSFLIIWKDNLSSAIPWILCPLLLGTLAEVFQYFTILSGTFDLVDFYSYITASFLSVSIFKLKNSKNEKQVF
nr:hypothetical protein [uncultured Draconibacterium sp.]